MSRPYLIATIGFAIGAIAWFVGGQIVLGVAFALLAVAFAVLMSRGKPG